MPIRINKCTINTFTYTVCIIEANLQQLFEYANKFLKKIKTPYISIRGLKKVKKYPNHTIRGLVIVYFTRNEPKTGYFPSETVKLAKDNNNTLVTGRELINAYVSLNNGLITKEKLLESITTSGRFVI